MVNQRTRPAKNFLDIFHNFKLMPFMDKVGIIGGLFLWAIAILIPLITNSIIGTIVGFIVGLFFFGIFFAIFHWIGLTGKAIRTVAEKN